jgi:L-alanine-DL-glutamate epimerase-like enolase superfamily enzyme
VTARLEVRPVRIPMERPFVHAGHARSQAASVLVAVDLDGVRGWGEAAPRSYVTGETVDTAVDALNRVRPEELLDLADPAGALDRLARFDLAGLLGRLAGALAPMPAAAAGLEIALFDAICRRHGQTGLDGLRGVPAAAALLRPRAAPAAVSVVLDLADDPARRLGGLDPSAVWHVKVKAGTDVEGCVRRVAAVRDVLGAGPTLSVDVNGAWDRDLAVAGAARLRPLGVDWLEEPVGPRDWAAMRAVREATGMAVMLDESCTGPADLDAAAAGAADSVNARVGKCGGLFPTLALVAAARERGLGVQLGVHVGEVGPLWAAGRLLACSLTDLLAVEGGRQDEWFPEPLTDPPYAVDRVRWQVAPLTGPGIGLVPTRALLDRCPPTSAPSLSAPSLSAPSPSAPPASPAAPPPVSTTARSSS